MTKCYFLLTVCLLQWFMSAGPLHAEDVQLGYFINEPHISIDKQTGQAKGVLVEFLQTHIAPEMGVRFQFIKQPLVRVLASMESGVTDGAVLFGYSPERAKRFSYPTNSFFSIQSVIAIKRTHPLTRISNADDLRSMHIVYAIGGITTSFIKNARIKMELLGGGNPLFRNLMRLKLGRVDAVYWPDESSVMYTLDRQGFNKALKILKIPEKSIPLFTIFSQVSKVKNLSARYDRAFEKVGGKEGYQSMMNAYIHAHP